MSRVFSIHELRRDYYGLGFEGPEEYIPGKQKALKGLNTSVQGDALH